MLCPPPDQLFALIDGRLESPDREAMEAHIQGCAACQQQLEQMDSQSARGPTGRSGEVPPLLGESDLAFLERLRALGRPGLLSGLSESPDQGQLGERDLLTGSATALWQEQPTSESAPLPSIHGFQILREIGRGGMGIVYEALDVALGRSVALKVLPPQWVSHPTAVGRFRREARAAGQLHHTNIVPVFGVGEDQGQLFYAMQYIKGEGLDRLWNRLRDGEKNKAQEPASSALAGHSSGSDTTARPLYRPLGFAREGSNSSYYRVVARIGQQVAEGLGFAHGQGIIHRDIKPSNLLLDHQGNVWIADFGLASAFEGDDGLTETGDVMGTVRYMAPERFDGVSGERSDVYALGVTLYELLTLRRLFPESDRAQLIQRILHSRPDVPRKLDRGIPRDLNAIVLKAIDPEPGRRYQTAAELAEDLRRFLASEPILPRPRQILYRSWLWCKRNPWLATAAGTLTVAILTVAVLSMLFNLKLSKAITKLGTANQTLGKVNAELENSLTESNRRLAALNFEQGYASFEKGESGAGSLRMAECYRLAAAAGDDGWVHTALSNLAAWRQKTPSIQRVLSHDHTGKVTCIAFSPDGKTLITGGFGEARLWDVETGGAVGDAMKHDGSLSVVLFSPDGKTVLTGSWDNTARLWYSESGKPVLAPFRHTGPVLSAAFSPDGRLILTGSFVRQGSGGGQYSTAMLWDAETGKQLRQINRGGTPLSRPVQWTAFRPDGKAFLLEEGPDREFGTRTGVDGKNGELEESSALLELDTRTGALLSEKRFQPFFPDKTLDPSQERAIKAGKLLLSFDLPIRPIHLGQGSRLLHAATSRDPTLGDLALPITQVASFNDEGLTILHRPSDHVLGSWQYSLGAYRMPLMPGSPVYGDPLQALRGSRAGGLAGRGFDPSLRLDAYARLGLKPPRSLAVGREGSTSVTLPGHHTGNVRALTQSPDGKTLVTGGDDKTARFWDSATCRPMGTPLDHPSAVTSLAFAPDGKTLATGCETGLVGIWDVGAESAMMRPLFQQDDVRGWALSRDGKRLALALGDGSLVLFDRGTRKLIAPEFQATSNLPEKGQKAFANVALSPDGKTIYTLRSRDSQSLELWDADFKKPTRTEDFGNPDHHITLGSAPGTSLCPGALYLMPNDYLNSENLKYQDMSNLILSPDGKKAITIMPLRHVAALWDTATWRTAKPEGLAGPTRTASFSPDGGKALAVQLQLEGSRHFAVVAPTNGEKTRTFLHTSRNITCGAFRPDGKTILAGSDDGTVELFDAATGQPLAVRLTLPSPVSVMAGSADGRTVVFATMDGMVRIYDSKTWRPVGWPVPHPRAASTLPEDGGSAAVAETASGARGAVTAVAISDDGTRFLTMTGYRKAWLWELPAVSVNPSQGLEWAENGARMTIQPDGSEVPADSVSRWKVIEQTEKGTLTTIQRPGPAVAESGNPSLDRRVPTESSSGAEGASSSPGHVPGKGTSSGSIPDPAVQRFNEITTQLEELWGFSPFRVPVAAGMVCLLSWVLWRRVTIRNAGPTPARSRNGPRASKRALAICFVTAAFAASYIEFRAYFDASRTLKALEGWLGDVKHDTHREAIEAVIGRSPVGPGQKLQNLLAVEYAWPGIAYTHFLRVEYSKDSILWDYQFEKRLRLPLRSQLDSQGSDESLQVKPAIETVPHESQADSSTRRAPRLR